MSSSFLFAQQQQLLPQPPIMPMTPQITDKYAPQHATINNPNSHGNPILYPSIPSLFVLYEKQHLKHPDLLRPASQVWDNEPLRRLFLCPPNIVIVQNGIRAGVFAQSNKQYLIDAPSATTLSGIMAEIFRHHAHDILDKTSITAQTERLNQITIEHCVPFMINEAKSYLKYIQDISTLPVPIAPPVSVFMGNELEYQPNSFTIPSRPKW